jgi:hypothetical protein
MKQLVIFVLLILCNGCWGMNTKDIEQLEKNFKQVEKYLATERPKATSEFIEKVQAYRELLEISEKMSTPNSPHATIALLQDFCEDTNILNQLMNREKAPDDAFEELSGMISSYSTCSAQVVVNKTALEKIYTGDHEMVDQLQRGSKLEDLGIIQPITGEKKS